MTALLVAALVLTNSWWLLVIYASGRRMLALEQAVRDGQVQLERLRQVLQATDGAVVQLLAHIPTRRGC